MSRSNHVRNGKHAKSERRRKANEPKSVESVSSPEEAAELIKEIFTDPEKKNEK